MGLYSDDEAAQMDMRRALETYQEGVNRHHEAGRGRSSEWLKTKLPVWMSKLEKCLGGKLSWADVELFTFLIAFFDDLEGAAASFAPVPRSRSRWSSSFSIALSSSFFDHPSAETRQDRKQLNVQPCGGAERTARLAAG